MRSDSKIFSQPLRLVWNGWESNTYALQNAGWELSVSEDLERRKMAIAMRHNESGMRGFSDLIDFDFFRHEYSMYQSTTTNEHWPTFGCRIGSDIILQIHNQGVSNYDFNPIDAMPMYSTIESMGIDAFAHFRKLEKTDNEIFLKAASMNDILKMALERQEPKQAQIRKVMVKRKEIDVMRNSRLKANLRLVT